MIPGTSARAATVMIDSPGALSTARAVPSGSMKVNLDNGSLPGRYSTADLPAWDAVVRSHGGVGPAARRPAHMLTNPHNDGKAGSDNFRPARLPPDHGRPLRTSGLGWSVEG